MLLSSLSDIQSTSPSRYDAIVVGGGFYGCTIAIYLAKKRRLDNVLLVEQKQNLITRASCNNQARVHNGYHYLRNFSTAYRSRVNLPLFVRDWPEAVHKNFTNIYAIARHQSKTSSHQFQRFCKGIGARLLPVDDAHRQLFDSKFIESAFYAEEYAFDADKLASWAKDELEKNNVEVMYGTTTKIVGLDTNNRLIAAVYPSIGKEFSIKTNYLFNCTYSNLNRIISTGTEIDIPLKHELAELALLRVPPELYGLGITVMDGPFFSLMPYPSRSLHTLSHVRYTPHMYWEDGPEIEPGEKLDNYHRETRVRRMVQDASRYLPSIQSAQHVDSIFEIKTIPLRNEQNDGRPILFRKHTNLPGCYSILGGKIDNIYEILGKLNAETIERCK